MADVVVVANQSLMLLIKIIDLVGLLLGLCLIAWAGSFYDIPMLVVGLVVLVGRQFVLVFARHRYGYTHTMFWTILDSVAYRWPF